MADYLKIPEVARRLDVSEKTARRYVKDGVLPSVFIGGAYRVSEEDLEAYLEDARVQPGKAPGLTLQLELEEQRGATGEEVNPERLRREFQEHSLSLEAPLQAWEETAAQVRTRKVPCPERWGLTVAYAASFLWKVLETKGVLDELQPQGAFAEALAAGEDLPEPLRLEVARLYDAIGRLTRISGIAMQAEEAALEGRRADALGEVAVLEDWRPRQRSLPPRDELATGAESA